LREEVTDGEDGKSLTRVRRDGQQAVSPKLKRARNALTAHASFSRGFVYARSLLCDDGREGRRNPKGGGHKKKEIAALQRVPGEPRGKMGGFLRKLFKINPMENRSEGKSFNPREGKEGAPSNEEKHSRNRKVWIKKRDSLKSAPPQKAGGESRCGRPDRSLSYQDLYAFRHIASSGETLSVMNKRRKSNSTQRKKRGVLGEHLWCRRRDSRSKKKL